MGMRDTGTKEDWINDLEEIVAKVEPKMKIHSLNKLAKKDVRRLLWVMEEQEAQITKTLAWIKERAVEDCRDCDGTGIYYGNVCLCGCVNSQMQDSKL